jgi:phosphomannomutase
MKFGTSGLRGLVTDLQGYTSALYATAFARYLIESGAANQGDQIYVAGDFRPSSPDIIATCIGALQRSGLNPIDCGSIPTPALALYAMSKGFASLMVTGSHIPADRNGIKFYRPDGEIDKTDELEITRIAAELRRQPIEIVGAAGASECQQAVDLFAARNMSVLPANSLSGMKIGVYQHSTVAREILTDILRFYGADVVELGYSAHFIPVDTEAVTQETVEMIGAWSREHRLDAIVSADGDGDRPLVADEAGVPVRGDLLGLIAAQFLQANVIVTPVTSNSGIDASGEHQVLRTKVGSPYVIAGMNEALAAAKTSVIGFEANGGVLTATDFRTPDGTIKALPTRDSVLPILAILYTAHNKRQPLSALVQNIALPAAAADRIENFAVERSAALMAYLSASTDNVNAFLSPIGTLRSIDKTDGLRVTIDNGMIIHLRPSGNAPEMRCYVEAENEASAAKLLETGKKLIGKWTGQS